MMAQECNKFQSVIGGLEEEEKTKPFWKSIIFECVKNYAKTLKTGFHIFFEVPNWDQPD